MIGDISVKSRGAEIIVKNEVKDFLLQNLSSLTRFSSAEILAEDIQELYKIELQKIEFREVVTSLRLDNIVASLARISRNKAIEIMEQERVFLNFRVETKPSKQVAVGDCIKIRGKGKFEFKEIVENTRKGKYGIKIEKYV